MCIGMPDKEKIERQGKEALKWLKLRRHVSDTSAGPVGVEPLVGRPEATDSEAQTLVHSRAPLVAPGSDGIEKGGVMYCRRCKKVYSDAEYIEHRCKK